MKRNKHDPLPLFEPPARWSNLPLDTRQKVVDRLAQLWVRLQQLPTQETTLIPDGIRQETDTTQETNHDQ